MAKLVEESVRVIVSGSSFAGGSCSLEESSAEKAQCSAPALVPRGHRVAGRARLPPVPAEAQSRGTQEARIFARAVHSERKSPVLATRSPPEFRWPQLRCAVSPCLAADRPSLAAVFHWPENCPPANHWSLFRWPGAEGDSRIRAARPCLRDRVGRREIPADRLLSPDKCDRPEAPSRSPRPCSPAVRARTCCPGCRR